MPNAPRNVSRLPLRNCQGSFTSKDNFNHVSVLQYANWNVCGLKNRKSRIFSACSAINCVRYHPLHLDDAGFASILPSRTPQSDIYGHPQWVSHNIAILYCVIYIRFVCKIKLCRQLTIYK